jgi:hypothetical protein
VILFCSSRRIKHNSENEIKNGYHISNINHFKVFVNYIKWIDEFDAKLDAKVDNLHVKRISIEDFIGYIYIVRVDIVRPAPDATTPPLMMNPHHPSEPSTALNEPSTLIFK